ncbi:MAG: DMT family transporter [Sphingobacteriales bacterium]|nr:DMT family transporter [Sphingobacteriales bacterium]
MLPYLFGLISAFCFGISNAYWKTAVKSNSFSNIVFFRGIIATSCFAITWFILSNSNNNTSLTLNAGATFLQYIKTVLLCLVCSLGLIFYLLSLNYSPVSISVPLSSINIFSILTAVFTLGETFKAIYFLSFAVAFCGILLSQSFQFDKRGIQWNKGATYSLLASCFWGITYALFKLSASWLGAIPLAFLLECCVTITALVWMIFSKSNSFKREQLSVKNIKHYFILAALLVGGTLFFNLAIQQIPVLVINILGNFTLIVSISAGIVFYKERLSIKQMAGVGLILISILLVQYVK